MKTTVFRSRHDQYQCGSTDKGEALARFFDGKLETDDAALAERLTKQPGFSKTPGAGDFWIDGPATAQANSVPKAGDDDKKEPAKKDGDGDDAESKKKKGAKASS